MKISEKFPKYNLFDPKVPVWCVTPNEGKIIHRFFDTSPFSPSGKYIALFRLPFEDHMPHPGDIGEVVLIDLEEGIELVVAQTRGWETQVGANVQWGTNDLELYYNDVETTSWTPFGVKINPFTGETTKLEGCIFMISSDGKLAATTCPMRAKITQPGYGVIIPDSMIPRNDVLAKDDGLFISDTATGKCKLLISIKDIIDNCVPKFKLEDYKNGEFYGFQCKWNPQGTRLLMVIRWISKDENDGRIRRNHVVTMKNDGTEICLAIPTEQWSKGGHHINWCPDGENLTMNLNIDGNGLRFVKVKYDGTGLHKILEDAIGSGHPTVHISERFILTDAYIEDEVAFGDGTIPIRLIDMKSGKDECLIRIKTQQPYEFSLRVDAHPAWDTGFRYIAFNGYAGDTRRVYIADLTNVIK